MEHDELLFSQLAIVDKIQRVLVPLRKVLRFELVVLLVVFRRGTSIALLRCYGFHVLIKLGDELSISVHAALLGSLLHAVYFLALDLAFDVRLSTYFLNEILRLCQEPIVSDTMKMPEPTIRVLLTPEDPELVPTLKYHGVVQVCAHSEYVYLNILCHLRLELQHHRNLVDLRDLPLNHLLLGLTKDQVTHFNLVQELLLVYPQESPEVKLGTHIVLVEVHGELSLSSDRGIDCPFELLLPYFEAL